MSVDLGTVADLPTKYQKLATEYSKMRAQVAVLKKAVFEEQSKVAELKDLLKERDHKVRKTDQEMESLQFRNQQLACRVSVLQDELNAMQHSSHGKSKKHAGDSVQTQIANNILGEELQQKIEENARLHQQVYENDFQHQKVVNQLQERLNELEKDVKDHDSVVDDINNRNKTLIDKLQQDKLLFEVKLQAAEKEAQEAKTRAETLQEELFITQQSLGIQLQGANLLIETHLPFVDSKIANLNSINVPRCSGRIREKSTQLVKQVVEIVCEIFHQLSKCHTYYQQRAVMWNAEESLGPATNKLAELLHQNCSYLKQLTNSYQAFESSLQNDIFIGVEMTPAFEDFVSKLHFYIMYLRKLAPYLKLSAEEENRISWLPADVKKKNELVLDGWHNFIAAFSKLDTYCHLLISNYNSSAKSRALISIVTSVGDLLNSIKVVCSHYNSKVLVVKDLPLISEKLKTTDECILASLVSLLSSFKKLHQLLSESVDDILIEDKKMNHIQHPAQVKMKTKLLANLKKRAVNYMCNLDQGPIESVPYAEAIRNRNLLSNSEASRESMNSQLVEAQEKVSKLEQLKEYWMLEYQLLKVKHEKLQKKLQQDFDSVSVGSEKSPSAESSVESPMVANSLLAKLECESAMESQQATSCAESEEIRQYFVKRINDLVAKRQLADSKATAFHSELVAMHRRLSLADKSKNDLLDQLQTSNEVLAKLKEELQTTTNNYKSQLSTMSEHLANMNDKLTTQKDEIDELKFALNNVGNRKTRGK